MSGTVIVDCWACAGEGCLDSSCSCEAIEDICCCADPEPRRCGTCRGTGSLTVSAEFLEHEPAP